MGSDGEAFWKVIFDTLLEGQEGCFRQNCGDRSTESIVNAA